MAVPPRRSHDLFAERPRSVRPLLLCANLPEQSAEGRSFAAVASCGRSRQGCPLASDMSIFSLKRFAFQTIRPVVSRKKRGFSAHFWPGGAVLPPRILPFSKAKCSSMSIQARRRAGAFARRAFAGRRECRASPHYRSRHSLSGAVFCCGQRLLPDIFRREGAGKFRAHGVASRFRHGGSPAGRHAVPARQTQVTQRGYRRSAKLRGYLGISLCIRPDGICSPYEIFFRYTCACRQAPKKTLLSLCGQASPKACHGRERWPPY